MNWLTKPTRATCGSCHDDVNLPRAKTMQRVHNLPTICVRPAIYRKESWNSMLQSRVLTQFHGSLRTCQE
jgi:hypothetical protein